MNEQTFTSSGTASAETHPGAPHRGTGPSETMHEEAEKFKSTAREQSAAAMEQIKEGMHSATQQARDAGEKFVHSQKESLAHRFGAYAEAARAASEKLGEGEGNMLAGPADKAAHQLERLSGYLRDKQPAEMFHDLENFARRKPEIVFGGLFVAGLAAARFLKASRRDLDRREAIIPVSGPDALEPVPTPFREPSIPPAPPVQSVPPAPSHETGTQSTTPPML